LCEGSLRPMRPVVASDRTNAQSGAPVAKSPAAFQPSGFCDILSSKIIGLLNAMPASWSNVLNRPVGDHELAIFYEMDGIDPTTGPNLRFGHLAESEAIDCLPSDQKDAVVDRYSKDVLWRQVRSEPSGKTEIAIGDDLHPHIRDILSGARADLATRWVLTDNAQRLLRSADLYSEKISPAGRIRKSIVLKHSQAAMRRHAAAGLKPRELKLTFEALDLILFSTGKGFVQVRTMFAPVADDNNTLCAFELLSRRSDFDLLNWGVSVAWAGVVDQRAF